VADGVSVPVVVVPSSLVNRSCSMFQRVSMSSLTFWLTPSAPVWLTVMLPLGFGVMV